MVVRALRRSDADEWQAVRARNHDWLRPWDATVPPGAAPRPSSYKVVTRSLLHQAKLGQCLPFVIEVDGRFAGQVTVSNVARGSAQWALDRLLGRRRGRRSRGRAAARWRW